MGASASASDLISKENNARGGQGCTVNPQPGSTVQVTVKRYETMVEWPLSSQLNSDFSRRRDATVVVVGPIPGKCLDTTSKHPKDDSRIPARHQKNNKCDSQSKRTAQTQPIHHNAPTPHQSP